jgi:SAM-dependent methyltransferase
MSETIRKIPSEVMATQPDLEAEFSTSGAIDPHDHLFWYVYDDPGLLDKSQALASYLSSGRDTVAYLRDILRDTRLATALANRENPEAPVSVLEFASGYGRVSRHFRNVIPDVRVVSCDIHEHAVRFLRGLGLDACQSSPVPEDLSTGQTFDAVFVLSFFTHMPRHTWSRWIRALQAQLKPGGLLIFTAHGEVSKGLTGVAELEPDGFHFTAASEQKDLPVAEYGNTVTVFDYVYAELACISHRE